MKRMLAVVVLAWVSVFALRCSPKPFATPPYSTVEPGGTLPPDVRYLP